MTRKELLRYGKEYLHDLETACCKIGELHLNFVRESIKALEQEPMQVELEGDGYADGKLVYDYGKCPKCGWDFEEGDKDWGEPYCCHCGQKLKWFDNEAESEG